MITTPGISVTEVPGFLLSIMPGINTMINRAKRINFNEVVQAAVAGTVREYEELQKLQMLTGKDSKGNQIGKYKNDKYAAEKHALNPLAGLGNMDFRLTGDFYKNFFTRLGTNSVFISSSDKKTEQLLKINKEVFGLNPQNASEYSIQRKKPAAIKVIRNIMHGHVQL